METTAQFCEIIRQRSQAHKKAIDLLSESDLTGQVMSVLRQELDSMVRVIYLLSLSLNERSSLINLTLTGKKWKIGKTRITDKQMVDLADTLNGWTKSVYKFGCAFIHLSSFHDYVNNDPFKNIDDEEYDSIKLHLNNYHDFALANHLTILEIKPYLPKVFNKIQSNLECYINHLEQQIVIEKHFL